MSLVNTLAKVAIGVAVAKGVSYVAKNGLPGAGASGSLAGRNPGRGQEIGGAQMGGADDILGQLGGMLGGATARGGSASGGLGSLIDSLAGGTAGSTARPRSRQASAPSGGLEDILGGLLGGLAGGTAGAGAGGLGSMLDTLLTGGSATAQPSREQELAAGLMLRAMIQAVKADGKLDEPEKRKLMQAMEGASEQEVSFVNNELSAPVDVDGLVSQVPQGMEAQVYAISLAAIDLDQQAEAQYLHTLAQALGIEPAEANAIHDKAGVPHIYR